MDYRGEVMIPIINLSDEHVFIENGERLCQIMIEKVNQIEWVEVSELNDSERGSGGFGSTGKK